MEHLPDITVADRPVVELAREHAAEPVDLAEIRAAPRPAADRPARALGVDLQFPAGHAIVALEDTTSAGWFQVFPVMYQASDIPDSGGGQHQEFSGVGR